MTAGDPSVWTVLEAVSTAVGSTILVLGAYFARRYGRRADPTIEASAFVRPAGGLGLQVRACAQSVGLIRLRPMDATHAPKITVTEVLDTGSGYTDGDVREAPGLFDSHFIEPGEKLGSTEVFYLPPATSNLVGWRIEFLFEVRRPLKWWECWTWADTIFVRTPEKRG